MESPAGGSGEAGRCVQAAAPSEASITNRAVDYRGKSGSVLIKAPPPQALPPAPVPVVKPAVPIRPMSPLSSPRTNGPESAKPTPPAKPEALTSGDIKPMIPTKPSVAAPARPPLPAKPLSPRQLVQLQAAAPGAPTDESTPAVPEKPMRPAMVPKPPVPQKPCLSDGEGDAAPPPPHKPRSMSSAAEVMATLQAREEAQEARAAESEDEGEVPALDRSDSFDDNAASPSLSRSQNVGDEGTKKRKGTISSFIRTMSNPNFVKKDKAANPKQHPLTSQKPTPLSEEQLQATLPPMKKTKHLKSPQSYFRLMLQYAVDMQFVSFDEVQALYPNEKLINRVVPQAKLGSKKFMKPFANVVETFLNIPNIYMQSWSEVFYARMVQFQNVLSANHLEALRLVVDYYVQQLNVSERQSHLRSRCLELFNNFLHTHRHDPDSALIGLAPGRLYRAKYEKFLASKREEKDQDTEADLSKKQLLDLIISWSESDDLERVGKKVKAFVHNIRHRAVTLLSEGDLVICQLPWAYVFGHEGEAAAESDGEEGIKSGTIRRQNTLQSRRQIESDQDNVVIARFVGREDDSVLVFHTAQELVKVKVEASSVFAFTRDMLDLLGQAKAMQNLVSDGADKLNCYLRDHIKTIVSMFLEEQDIQLDQLKRANNNEATLADLFCLRRYRDKLDEIVEHPDELLNRVDSFSCQIISKFTESMQHRDLFQPVRAQTLSELGSWPYCSLAKSRVKRWQGVVDSTLMQLDIEKRLVLNSTRKLQLSEWWLGLIRSNVKQLLLDNMYDFHAVNSDYIESPPDDIDSIRQNLELIQEILSPALDKHGVVDKLIKPLTGRIYPKLDELVEVMHVVLMDQSFDHGQVDMESFNLAQYEGRLREATGEPGGPNEELTSRLLSLVKDIRYIREMKTHEQNFRKEQVKDIPGLERSKSFVMVDAVPVSGLIMNYFHRMEVELKTVLELWQDQDTIDNWHRQRGLPVPARISKPQRVVHNRLPPGARGSALVPQPSSEPAPPPETEKTPLNKTVSAKMVVSLDHGGKSRSGQLAKIRAKAIPLPRPPSLMRESDSEGEGEAEGEQTEVKLRIPPVTFVDPSARLSTYDLALLSPRSVRANASKLPLLESPRKEPLSSSPQDIPTVPHGLDDPTSSSAGESRESPRLLMDSANGDDVHISDGSEEALEPCDEEESIGRPPSLKRVNTDPKVQMLPMTDEEDMIISGF